MHSMLGFTSLWAVCCTIAGMEIMHTIRQGQLIGALLIGAPKKEHTPARFYALAT